MQDGVDTTTPRMGLPQLVRIVHHTAEAPNGFIAYYHPAIGQWFTVETSGCLVNVSEPFATRALAEAHAHGIERRWISERNARDERRGRRQRGPS